YRWCGSSDESTATRSRSPVESGRKRNVAPSRSTRMASSCGADELAWRGGDRGGSAEELGRPLRSVELVHRVRLAPERGDDGRRDGGRLREAAGVVPAGDD